jgi:hypothetical protein
MADEATTSGRIGFRGLRRTKFSGHGGEVGIWFSAGYQFPRRNHNKNDDSNQICPASSFLELFMIDHCCTSQN